MSMLNFLRKKRDNSSAKKPCYTDFREKTTELDPLDYEKEKKNILNDFFKEQSRLAPNQLFVTGPVFDLCREYRKSFSNAIQSQNAALLLQNFTNLYSLFLNTPELVGLNPVIINKNNNDTNPATWNLDFFNLSDNETAVILYMPTTNDALAARIVGIIFSDKGDGYYYCMLNKHANTPSVIYRNIAKTGIRGVTKVSGFGVELMQNFLNCITADFRKNH